jgi:copper/silver efflux system protein
MFLGLVPIMWSTGTGADVMKRIAAPMIGGIFTSFVLELLVYPGLYQVWKWHFDLKPQSSEAKTVGVQPLQPACRAAPGSE